MVLPAGYGGVNGANITELHIYGAEQQGGPETVTITVTSASPFTFNDGVKDLTAFSFVDGNTYEFDVSAMTAVGSLTVNKTVAIVKDPDDISAGSVVQMGPTDGSTLSYTHVATTDDLYVVGVDITDPLNPALIPTADDNLEIGDVGSEAQPAATQLAAVPITYTDKVGMGTDATDGVAVTDMLRDIQSSVSTEGAMEKTTYILNGQVVGYSETEAMMATDPGGYTPPAGGYTPPAGGTSSNIELYDANDEWVGSYNKQGDGGYNLSLTVKTNADVDLNGDGTANFGDSAAADKEYFVEIMKNAYMMMEGTTSTLQENETVNYYKVATVNGEEQADMSASGKLGSEQTFDGVTSIYDGNGASLGQKSSVDFTDASAAAAAGIREVADAEFAELPASFKAASGKTYVREETFGDAMQQSTEATYMDDKGKALGYAYGNSDTYTDPVTQKTVTNSNLNFQSAEREPLGSIRMDGMGETRKVIEFIDNQNGDKKVDIDSDSTTGDGDGNEITLLGVIRVETETETPFKVDASGAVTNQLETAPVSTMTHYFNIANDDHLGGIEVDGATTVLVGPNWAYGAAQTDVNKLALTPADMNALPAEFVEYVLDPSDSAGAQTFDIKVKVVSDKFVFTKGTSTDVWDPSVDGINELDTYVFDTSDPSMKGYMLGFSTAKDNAGDDKEGNPAKALTSAEGVTVSDKDPGEAGAKTTLVLPAGYGGVNNTNVTELHIYGAEQQGGPETVTITVETVYAKEQTIQEAPILFKVDGVEKTSLEFVDGNTYRIDVSKASLDGLHVNIVDSTWDGGPELEDGAGNSSSLLGQMVGPGVYEFTYNQSLYSK